MTEQRFELNNPFLEGSVMTGCIMLPILDRGNELRITEVLDLLNELHEENMMLKGAVAHYKLILMSLEEEAKRMSQIHCKGGVG